MGVTVMAVVLDLEEDLLRLICEYALQTGGKTVIF